MKLYRIPVTGIDTVIHNPFSLVIICSVKKINMEIKPQLPLEYILQKIGLSNVGDWVNSIPRLDIGDKVGWTDYIDFIKYEDLTHSLMWGYDKYNRLFLAIQYHVENPNSRYSENRAITVFQRYTGLEDPFVNGTYYCPDSIFNMNLMTDNYWKILKTLIETGMYVKDNGVSYTFPVSKDI